MFTTVLRCLANTLKPRLTTKLESKEDNRLLANVVRAIVRDHGPVTVTECWNFAKEEGLTSRRQMKIMLRWLRDRHEVRVQCRHLTAEKGSSSSKEFLFSLASSHHVSGSEFGKGGSN